MVHADGVVVVVVVFEEVGHVEELAFELVVLGP